MGTTDMQGKFAIINIILNRNDITIVDALNGRVGDSGRLINFALKDGDLPHDLSGQNAFIRAKDASGAVKQISGIYNMVSMTGGLFSMLIPSEMYQSAGDVTDAYLAVTDENGLVVSSIPIGFSILENNMVITANASQLYIDDVNQLIKKINSDLESTQNAVDSQKRSIDSLNSVLEDVKNAIDNNTVAKLPGDNVMTGNNKFTKPIDASILGNAASADKSLQADNATQAANALNANVASYAKKALHTTDDSGWTDVTSFIGTASGTCLARKSNGVVEVILLNVKGYYYGGTQGLVNGNQIVKLPWAVADHNTTSMRKIPFVYNGDIGLLSIATDTIFVSWVKTISSSADITFNASFTITTPMLDGD
ncbi:hypothetical protein CRI85_02660 [Leuconostoc pseudomesenteroides]|uniref:BppU family phage baseplate upper protein n=1 Tax=Leuconostoc pseudomesenteroides TaxID=33968 RepID=UPI001E3DA5D7|nr:BppU family phage baseplate upper protein [Leuconostoc pseudomesenteroides]MCC8439249.1 hypothetical protein [Leuconostoc pseudomesenteroides]